MGVFSLSYGVFLLIAKKCYLYPLSAIGQVWWLPDQYSANQPIDCEYTSHYNKTVYIADSNDLFSSTTAPTESFHIPRPLFAIGRDPGNEAMTWCAAYLCVSPSVRSNSLAHIASCYDTYQLQLTVFHFKAIPQY